MRLLVSSFIFAAFLDEDVREFLMGAMGVRLSLAKVTVVLILEFFVWRVSFVVVVLACYLRKCDFRGFMKLIWVLCCPDSCLQ